LKPFDSLQKFTNQLRAFQQWKCDCEVLIVLGATIMELKHFTNLIDALGKVADGLKAIVSLPEAE
jgi:hypothetical protein